jgi:N-methylhydantoinase B
LWRLGPARLSLRSPGGGGFGDPLRRDPAKVLRDVRDETVSGAAARDIYGVVIAADGKSVDTAATKALRRQMESSREGVPA